MVPPDNLAILVRENTWNKMNSKLSANRRILITGTAGFIGFHLAKLLLHEGFVVHGYDGMTDYYDVALKQRRHAMLLQNPNFAATEGMLEDQDLFDRVADNFEPDVIVHLAAQAGVRYSLENPRAYLDSNVIGTFNVMEAARRLGVQHLLMASTSSVYGANTEMPFIETEKGRHAADDLCGHQEGEREHGPCLCASLRSSDNDVQVLYRLRSVGPSRSGALQVCRCDPRWAPHRHLQQRRHVPRLYVRR